MPISQAIQARRQSPHQRTINKLVARKKKHPEHENHERWLVSYADFITLLFAFFVVMFASSQTDKGKQKQMQESVKKAMEESKFSATLVGILGGTPDDNGKGNAMMKGPGGTKPDTTPIQHQPQVVEVTPALERLKKELQAEIESGAMVVQLTNRGLVVSLQQAAFFPSGGDGVATETYAAIQKVAKIISSLSSPIRFEGHTDSMPIKNKRFSSNWELSAARAIAMMELLSKKFGIPESRMSIGGYADTVPVTSNDTVKGRARNRRVDIVILSAPGILDQPQAATQ